MHICGNVGLIASTIVMRETKQISSKTKVSWISPEPSRKETHIDGSDDLPNLIRALVGGQTFCSRVT